MTCPLPMRWIVMVCFCVSSSPVVAETASNSVLTGDSLQRVIPDAAGHPGNVYTRGERVRIGVPPAAREAVSWRVQDERGREIAQGVLARDRESTELGELPVGWYRVSWHDAETQELAWTTAAVLEPLAAPTPLDSPICVDAAISWFAKDDPARQEAFSQLAALAGVNWVRDRMRWREIMPTPDELTPDTTSYDTAADLQHGHGLQVLQVYHDTPRWAAEGRRTGRFPLDLRHVYHFAKLASQRYRGRVQAWEPWNEANVANFGAHTIEEICSYQKAAYWGFKAAAPETVVCWSVTTGVPTARQTAGVLLNEAWSYFDTYNIHTYDWADSYERLWQPARQAACGKPLWITESDRGIKAHEDSTDHDLSMDNQRLKAEYVSQSYVQSLHAGADRHFHFILGQYNEEQTQFGLLRHDMTPRPGYVALATLGRLLAGARCLGRLEQTHADLHAYAFTAFPDGQSHDVLVVWVEQNVDWAERGRVKHTWTLPAGLATLRVYDYLGRDQSAGASLQLTSAPLLLILPAGACADLPLARPTRSEHRSDSPCPVVLQLAMPAGAATKLQRIEWAWEYEQMLEPGTATPLPLFAYNFGQTPLQGTVRVVRQPDGCTVEPHQWQVALEPLERSALPARVTLTDQLTSDREDNWFVLEGDFGDARRSVLAFRLNSRQ